ncbi:proline-rich family protein [Raphanus sativus]|uniref:Flocculation protein FLO11 n=1 Tax=Raphanus sativus TaxID=3726 RepID=A0A6J0P5L6_RAPSA|nr:flocculation protein FLO11 [Raphanus sativus]KAJ4893186.1 proline-rich family protein [Raphanus sativus]
MLTHDRDEELSMFLEMRRREKERRGESLLTGSDNTSINGALTAALSGVSETVSSQRYPLRRTAAENFLYSENEKTDYDWLLTPPGTPQFEKESHRSVMEQSEAPSSRPTALKSRLGNCREDIVSGNNNKLQMSSSSSVAGLRRPSSSGSSRSTTPTTSTTRPVTTTRASTSRSSTPTSRATLTAARATTSTTAPRTTTSARSATPTRSTTQPSSAPSKKPVSRPATPTRRSPTPTGPSMVSSKAPSRGTSPTPTPTNSIVSSKAPSRGTSPTPALKSSQPWKPREMPGFSLEAPPNLRTSVSDRPVSATRGRPGAASAPGSRSNSIERGNGPTGNGVGHVRRQSCSPSRGRAPIGNTNGNGSLQGARGRGKANNGDGPVAMGNKMVERVVNMRKLGPPRLTESGGRGNAKSSSAFNSLGYGRNLSKSSIDMALRHMDIRRGMTGNLRPLVTKVPASSMYSVRSRSNSVTNSPVATSSTVSSSEPNLDSINILCLDGNDAENDDLLSERSFSSPRDQFPKLTS